MDLRERIEAGIENKRSVRINITEACNFGCGHCFNGKKHPAKHMSLDDFDLLLERLAKDKKEEELMFLTLTGGEPTIHPYFERILSSVRYANMRNDLNAEITLQTNGWNLLKNTDDFVRGLFSLRKLGVTDVRIGADLAHVKYAKKAGLGLDYANIGKMAKEFYTRQIMFRANAKHFLSVELSGSVNYVIPIGAAANMDWEERISLTIMPGSEHRGRPKSLEDIKKKLEKSYHSWHVDKTPSGFPCLAGLAFLGYADRNPENRPLSLTVDTELNINLCELQQAKPLGNLRKNNISDLQKKLYSDSYYSLLAKQGPQGVAREYTDWSESEIKERFIERLPCGLCNDIKKSGYFGPSH